MCIYLAYIIRYIWLNFVQFNAFYDFNLLSHLGIVYQNLLPKLPNASKETYK